MSRADVTKTTFAGLRAVTLVAGVVTQLDSAQQPWLSSDTRLSWPLVHRLSWAKLSQHKHEHSPEPGPSTALCDRFSQLENICNCENILQKCAWKQHINCDKTAHMFGFCYDEDGDNTITVKWHHWSWQLLLAEIFSCLQNAWLIVDK